MKKRFLANGERAFDDYQLLELLLFYSVPQVDTNPIAHRLLERFHSLSAVMEASVEELMTVDGVGEHTAVLIQLLPQFARRYHQDRVKMDSAVNRMEDAGTLLAPYFYGAKREMVYLLSLDARKPVVVCGDMNVAHEEIDLKNPKTNRGNAGFSDEERAKMTRLLASGFTDTFRYLYPDLAGAYSWWSYRFHAREKNAGWRIDYFLVSDRLRDRIEKAEIHADVLGSDHCPVSLTLRED